jgi:hypothetical protein
MYGVSDCYRCGCVSPCIEKRRIRDREQQQFISRVRFSLNLPTLRNGGTRLDKIIVRLLRTHAQRAESFRNVRI